MYDFILYLDTTELSDDELDRLFEAGCGDGLPGSSRGEPLRQLCHPAAGPG
jgi:hypothetical protein